MGYIGYTCEVCHGIGIMNYDSDLSRLEQETCIYCDGAGVVYEKVPDKKK